jgi:hypothetical protein
MNKEPRVYAFDDEVNSQKPRFSVVRADMNFRGHSIPSVAANGMAAGTTHIKTRGYVSPLLFFDVNCVKYSHALVHMG